MSIVNENYESKYDDNGKNKSKICCQHCLSVILSPGVANHQLLEFELPFMRRKAETEDEKVEQISHYWLVENIYTFDNVSVTKKVDKIKYLACADCEIGPIGYIDISTNKSYVALSRVIYEEEKLN